MALLWFLSVWWLEQHKHTTFSAEIKEKPRKSEIPIVRRNASLLAIQWLLARLTMQGVYQVRVESLRRASETAIGKSEPQVNKVVPCYRSPFDVSTCYHVAGSAKPARTSLALAPLGKALAPFRHTVPPVMVVGEQ